ncbi:MAG: alanine racemase [Acidimicrobiia bacterium]|nr:alanine racemase [Acidimicrobiia bacterium]
MRPSHVEVDLEAIRSNVATIAAAVEPAMVCAVVKADGYGHGDIPAAEMALEGGAAWLAVALVEEGIRLREAGIDAPVLLLSEPTPEEAPQVVKWRLVPTVYRHGFLDILAEIDSAGAQYPVHLKVDTGMHRVGAAPRVAAELAHRIHDDPGFELQGVWTHFAVAEEDAAYTNEQIDRFDAFVAELAASGIRPSLLHAANTAGGLLYPAARYSMVRAGIGIYGLRPAPDVAPEVRLQPAMRVVSAVSYVRDYPAGARPSYGRRRPLPDAGRVATVPIGYADGVSRRLSSVGGEVLVRGKRYPYAGTVTMDQIVVDVGADPIEVGDEVVVMGAQGNEEVSADNWAEWMDTINYEVVCNFGPRLPRHYRRGCGF